MQGEQPEPEAEAEADGAGEAAPQAPGVAVEQLPQLLEAVLFVADGPVEEAALARALGVTRRQLGPALEALGEVLRTRGVRLLRGPEGAQLVTAPQAAWAIEQFLGVEAGRRLSTAALETLAIIAYRQPVTRAVVEAVRGVNSDGAVDTLRARGLIEAVGRADGPGRPALFAITQRFLEYFGLERAADLPALPAELAERMEQTEQGVQLALEAGEPWAGPAPSAPARAEGGTLYEGPAAPWGAPGATAGGALSFARGGRLPGAPAGASGLPAAGSQPLLPSELRLF
ncbi:MAG: SMC-Scp complex subunit ScpB [Chloroflexi bacterium]|nr:SMC-Scp complex subunit ScpB [Chloroflexota bacterium]